MTQDCARASSREPGGSLPPAYMPSIQSGFEELGAEQLEQLQREVKVIKNNYRRGKVSVNDGWEHAETKAPFEC